MLKNKLDYKVVNTLLVIIGVYLIIQTKDFWISVISMIYKIGMPFLIAFAIAYALYPIVEKLMRKNIPKALAVMIVLLIVAAILVLMVLLAAPLLFDQARSLFNGIVAFLKELSLDYNINFKDIQDTLSSNFNSILETIGTYVSNGAISVISISLEYLSKFFIIATAFVYFLIDMDRIRAFTKKYFRTKSDKIYYYVKTLDDEMQSYLSGFIKIVIISFFEYSIIYTIIGHPNAILLGGFASFGNLIPYFGGIITNIIAAITAFVISPELFIKTCIVFMIFSFVDGNVINPLIYGKTNKIHPLVVIISVFAGGILFGVLGIAFALPVSILIVATLKYFKDDILKLASKKSKK
ncbi:MAG: AI-2E family transporter [Bacilli bacterium]|nr:AI-2E family transporter [Bacilli bacterium]